MCKHCGKNNECRQMKDVPDFISEGLHVDYSKFYGFWQCQQPESKNNEEHPCEMYEDKVK